MKKDVVILVLGMFLVIIGALLKITGYDFSNYVLFIGLAIEAFVLGSLIIKSLRNVK